MNSRRLFFALVTGMLLLVIAGLASVIYGDQFLKDKAEELEKLKVQSLSLQEQQRTLVQAKRDVQNYSELESIAKTVVPQEKDQARTVREIISLADSAGVNIATITFPSSTLGDKKPSKSTGAKDDAKSAPAPANTTSQIEPVKEISGLYQMDINVQGGGTPVPYQSFLDFLAKLEQNRRTAQVINLNVQPASSNRNEVTFSLIIRVYIKP